MSVPDASYRESWRAAAGAAFAEMVLERIRAGNNGPSEAEADRMFEEADSIGQMFAERATRDSAEVKP